MEVEAGSDFRKWDELMPDALGLIFNKLSLQDILTVIPRVCKAWAKTVEGPYCWQEIDILEWSTRWRPDQLNRMLRLLITRSCGSLRILHVSRIYDDHLFEFIAEHAGSLQILTLSRSKVSDFILEKVAEKFSALTSLDMSYCEIGARGLEALGKNCKMLSTLSFNMEALDILASTGEASQADEARAIAKTMPKLKHLELACLHANTESILEILSGCPELEYLDLRGCWCVQLDKILEEKHPQLKVIGPQHGINLFPEFWPNSIVLDYSFMEDGYYENPWEWEDDPEDIDYYGWWASP